MANVEIAKERLEYRRNDRGGTSRRISAVSQIEKFIDDKDGGRSGDVKDADAINCGLMIVLRNAFSVLVRRSEREFNGRAHKIAIPIYLLK